MKTFQLQFIFFAALALSLVLTPLFARLARRWNIVDRPAHRKTHTQVTPYLGGVSIFLSLLLAFTLSLGNLKDLDQYLWGPGFAKALFILGCSLGVMAIGIWDDIRNIRARYKLLGQFFFVALFTIFGFHFEVLHLPGLPAFHLSYLGIPVTIFWMLAIINAFNMVDGLDGLTATVAAGSLLLLAAGTAMVDNLTGLTLAIGALGAVLGFLPSNWNPARIYLGDAGSGGLGTFMACSLVAMGQTYGQSYYKPSINGLGQPFFYQIIIATLLVAYPSIEIILSVTRRLLHGRHIARADQGHIHHRFLKAGLNTQSICWIALILTLLPGMSAFATIAKYHGWATWFMAAFGVIIGLGLPTLGFLDFLKPKVVSRLRPHFQIAHHFIAMQKIKLSLASDRKEVLALVNQACQELGVKSYRLIVRSDEKGKGGLDYTHQWDPTRHSTDLKVSAFEDNVRLLDRQGGADWVFEPQSEAEEELNTEYRVLISEFMLEALQAAARLGKHQPTLEVPSVAPLSLRLISGHNMRKRHNTKLN